MSILTIIILSGVSLVAGFIDSIAGGGGLLTIPAFILAGVPPQMALGTNKFQATLGTSVATINFFHKGKISIKIVLSGIVFALAGAFIGSRLIISFSPELAGRIIVFMLPIGMVATLFPRKNITGQRTLTNSDLFVKIPLICLIIGFYDGFFGPGTGSFLTILFYLFLHLNLTEANANAKVFNFISNLGALTAFLISSKVFFQIAIPMALTNMIGNYIGSHLAIKKGDKLIKFFLIIVLVILSITLIYKYFIR